MLKYAIKRTLLLIPTLIVVVTIVFCLIRLVPGSPVAAMVDGEDYTPEEIWQLEEEMGFYDPLWQQYLRYVGNILKGDWGISYDNSRPVFENILQVWEPSLLIAILGTVITVVIALPVGVLSATHRNSPLDYLVTSTSMVCMSIPGMVWGLSFAYFFGYILDLFPVMGYKYIDRVGLWQSLYYVMLPSLALGLHHVASLVRYTRSTMLDVLNQDYIRTAKAKGLPRGKIYYKHALKNTLSIVATSIVGSFVGMLGGTAVTERVFSIRGMGTLAVSALSFRDYNQEQAIVLLTAFICLGVNLLMDIFYKVLDPRIEYE